MWDTYAHLVEDLPDERHTADESIGAARRDIPVTYEGVIEGQTRPGGEA